MLPGLVSQNGYDYNAVHMVFEAYGVDKKTRQKMLPLIVKLIEVVDNERKARAK